MDTLFGFYAILSFLPPVIVFGGILALYILAAIKNKIEHLLFVFTMSFVIYVIVGNAVCFAMKPDRCHDGALIKLINKLQPIADSVLLIV